MTETNNNEAPETTEQPVESAALETQNQELKKQLVDVEDKYLRLFAEFDNYRKRTNTEKDELNKYACGKLIENMLPVLDSFCQSESAFNQNQQNVDLDGLKKGFSLVHRQLEDVLQKFGVKKIEATGQIFDPKFHEAVMEKESELPAHTVVEELRSGYTIYEKVLRPTMVVVAK